MLGTNLISLTAHYTLMVRAGDAEAPRPICCDRFAQRLVSDESRATWRLLGKLKHTHSGIAVRHRVIDEVLLPMLRETPSMRVVILGAGFDTRAFRLRGGRWLEMDEPAIIREKEARLPASEAPNPLTRVAIDFAVDSLAEKLAPFSEPGPACVIAEGVFMYLDEAQIASTARALQQAFPRHLLVGDLVSRRCREVYASAFFQALAEVGVHPACASDRPQDLFRRLDYEVDGAISIALRAAELRLLPVHPFLVRKVMRVLREGHAVFRFASRAWGQEPGALSPAPGGAPPRSDPKR